MDWLGRPWLLRAAALAAVCMAGCAGGAGRTDKNPVSALWVEAEDVSQVDGDLLSRLAQVNVQELFIPLAELDLSSGASPLERRTVPELPPGARVVIVVRGQLELAGRDLDEAAAGVAEGLQQLLFDLESRGISSSGVHFDLRAVDPMDEGRSFFVKLRDALDSPAYLSLTLPWSRMSGPALSELGKAVDFVVPYLYGQREDDADSNEAWDFEAAKRRLGELEQAGLSYMMGVSGIGSATHVGNGRVKSTTLKQSLSPFMMNRHLELKRGFSLKATNLRIYTFVAQQATRAGGWQIQNKDEVRLVRPMTSDIGELLDIVAQGEYPGHLGQLYYRLPRPEERLSITVENILNAHDSEPVMPDIDFDVKVIRRTRQGALYRFVVTSANRETTEYAPLSNFLQVTTEPNAFGDVAAGDFYRYDLLRTQPGAKSERAIRNANALRLDLPILEGERRAETGDVEIRLRNPTLTLEAKFMMPDGRVLDYGPLTWKDGEFQGREEDEEGDPAAAESE